MTTDQTHVRSDLPGYVLLERIGAGALSTVYRGHVAGHPERVAAIKRLRAVNDPDVVARARREAEALAKLRHPAIARILDVVPDGDGVAIVLPYLEGGSLADRLAQPDPLPAGSAAAIGATIAEALAAAHAHGVVHRDVKPANILFTATGEPVLTDFGIARIEGTQRLTAHGRSIGTAEYLDPAVAAGGEPDARSDIYALGVVAYEALAGTPPYAGSTPLALRAADRGLHVPLREAVPDAPPQLVAAIERAMARDPAQRFARADEFAEALRAAASEVPEHTYDPGPVPEHTYDPGPVNDTSTSLASDEVPVGDRSGGTQLPGPRLPQPPQPVRTRRTNRPALLAIAALLGVAVIAATAWLVVRPNQPTQGPPTLPVAGPPEEPAEVPTPDTTGRDFQRMLREMIAFQGWLKSNPRPELLSAVYDPACDCYPRAVKELSTLRDHGLRFEGRGSSVERVEVVEALDTLARLQVSLRHLDQDLVLANGTVLKHVEGAGLSVYHFTLGLSGDRWRIKAITRLG